MKTSGTVKKLLVGAMAAMVVMGMQVTAFAAVDSSSEDSSDATVSSQADETPSAISGEISGEGQPEGTVNDANPDTGVAVLPAVAALLAIGSVPVILKTRK